MYILHLSVNKSLTLTNFNLYLFKDLRLEFKDLMTTLMARSKFVTFLEPYSYF